MAFCSSCGAHLEGDERFCVKCGHEVKANGAATPAVMASVPAAAAEVVAAPQVVAAPPPQDFAAPPPQGFTAPPPQGFAAPPPQGYAVPPAQGFTAPPQGYPGYPGQPPIPIVMGAPPAQPKRHIWIWVVVIIIVVLYGLYYIGTHDNKNQQVQQPTAPAQQPAAPDQQPGGNPAQTGDNSAVVSQQSFTGQASIAQGGIVQITNARWVNNSNVAIQSATLGCQVLDANGATLGQLPFTLTGPRNAPVQPGATVTFNTIKSSTGVANASTVNCSITGVTPAS